MIRIWILTVAMAVWAQEVAGGDAPSGEAEGLVEAEVVKVSNKPDPKTAPYADCLVGILCRSKADGQEFIALFDLFVGRVSYPAAGLKPGDGVLIRKVKLEDVPTRKRTMRANDFLNPTIPEYFAADWPVQTAFENSVKEEVAERVSATHTEIIRRTLISHDGELTGGLIDDFYFWSHHPGVYVTDFWKDQKPTREKAIGSREAILRFHRELESRGIRLLFVAIPRSTSIYPGMATNIAYDPEIDGAINQPVIDLLSDLEASGVECVDLTGVFLRNRYVEWEGEKYPIYRRNDSHWSGAGVRLAAEVIADRVGATGKEKAEVRVVPEVIEQAYTLPEFGGVKPRRAPAERELVFRVDGEDDGDFDPHRSAAGIHLLGDSFAGYGGAGSGSYGLHPHVVAKLGEPVNLIYAGAGGPMISRSQFAREADLSKVKLVIWMMAESFLVPPDIWFEVKLGDASVTHLEFSLDRARPGSGVSLGEFEGFGTGIEFPSGRVASVVWDGVKIAPKPSVARFSGIVEIGPVPGAEVNPATGTFSVLIDGQVIKQKQLHAESGSLSSPRWSFGLKKFAGKEVSLELRSEIESETPGAWTTRWSIPQLENAGFEGVFETGSDGMEPKGADTSGAGIGSGGDAGSGRRGLAKLGLFGVLCLLAGGLLWVGCRRS